jgi:hypothetical protein
LQIARFDHDGSGDISFDEFLPWWREVMANNQVWKYIVWNEKYLY